MGNKYVLSNTPTTTHRVETGKQIALHQEITFAFEPDDIEMLVTVLRGVKEDPNIPHSFSNINATYNFFYEPSASINQFVIRHVTTGRPIAITLSAALKLLDAIEGKTERLVED